MPPKYDFSSFFFDFGWDTTLRLVEGVRWHTYSSLEGSGELGSKGLGW